jgi:hypothetical protein
MSTVLADRARARRRIPWRGLAALLTGVLFFLAVFAPPRQVYEAGDHDPSSHATFEFYAAKRYQFGTQVVQNVGPYGYAIYSLTFADMSHTSKLVLHFVLRLALTILVLRWARTFEEPFGFPLLASLWVAAFILCPGVSGIIDVLGSAYYEDTLSYVTIYLAGLTLLRPRTGGEPLLSGVLTCGLLALMSLMKHSCFAESLVVLAAMVLQGVLAGRARQAARLVVAYAVTFVLLWVAAGQQLGGLAAFLRGIALFGGGYNESQALPEPWVVFAAGVLAMTGLFAASVYRSLRRDGWRVGVARTLFEAGFLFFLWKHGFVRADMHHTQIVFVGVALVVFPWCWSPTAPPPSPASEPRSGSQVVRGAVAAAILAAACVGFAQSFRHEATMRPQFWPQMVLAKLEESVRWLVHPGLETSRLRVALQRARLAADLPRTRRRVGDAAIDQFGWSPGWVLLNGLRYAPRPMPITFAAVNERLESRNAEYYSNPATAPQFVLARHDRMDTRLVAEDDALALRALVYRYRPVLFERGNLLLECRSVPAPDGPAVAVLDQTVTFGQPVAVPDARSAGDDYYSWASVDIRPSLLGRLIAFLYKPQPCYLNYSLRGAADPRSGRIVTSIASNGFFLSPMLEVDTDFPSVYRGPADRKEVIAFAVDCGPHARLFFDPAVHVRIDLLPAPSAADAKRDAGGGS